MRALDREVPLGPFASTTPARESLPAEKVLWDRRVWTHDAPHVFSPRAVAVLLGCVRRVRRLGTSRSDRVASGHRRLGDAPCDRSIRAARIPRDRAGDLRWPRHRRCRKRRRRARVLRGRGGRRRLQEHRRRRIVGARLRSRADRPDRRDRARAGQSQRRVGRHRRIEPAQRGRRGRGRLALHRRRSALDARRTRRCREHLGDLDRPARSAPRRGRRARTHLPRRHHARRVRHRRRRPALEAYAVPRSRHRRFGSDAQSGPSVDAVRRHVALSPAAVDVRQRRPARRCVPLRRQRHDVAQADARSAGRSRGESRPRRRPRRPRLRRDRDQARRVVALGRRRYDLARDAAQPVPRRAAVLLHPRFRRSRGCEPAGRHRADPVDEHRRRQELPRDRDQRRLGLPQRLVVRRRPARPRRRRRRRDDLRRRRCAYVATVRAAVLAAVSSRPGRRGSALSRLCGIAGQQLVVRSVDERQRHRRDQPRLGADRARRRHVVGVRSERSEPDLVDRTQPRQRPSLSDRPAHESGLGALARRRAERAQHAGRRRVPLQLGQPDRVRRRRRRADRGERRVPQRRSRQDLAGDQPRSHPQRRGAPAAPGWSRLARRIGRRDVGHDPVRRDDAARPRAHLGHDRRRPGAAHPRRRRALEQRHAERDARVGARSDGRPRSFRGRHGVRCGRSSHER